MKETNKNKKLKEGFTLLEMLVVVLVIGILAGIALPQYRKVKEKAEASELLINVKALNEAQHRYYLAKGAFAENFDDLDIELSGYEKDECTDFSAFRPIDCLSNNKSVLLLNRYKNIHSLRKTGNHKKSGFYFRSTSSENLLENKLYCYEYSKNGFCSDLLKCDLSYEMDETNSYYSCNF